MKTIKLVFTVMAVAIVAMATAVEKPKMNVIPLTADRAIVSIQNDKEALLELSIHAESGDLVYYKQSAKPLSSYQKIFDFTDLENGNYTMALKVNDTRLTKEISVNSKEIVIGKEKLRFDPYFAYADNELKLSYLNFDKELYVLSIYGEYGLVYESKLGNELALTSGYDLSKLAEGNYKVVLSSLNSEFSFNIEK